MSSPKTAVHGEYRYNPYNPLCCVTEVVREKILADYPHAADDYLFSMTVAINRDEIVNEQRMQSVEDDMPPKALCGDCGQDPSAFALATATRAPCYDHVKDPREVKEQPGVFFRMTAFNAHNALPQLLDMCGIRVFLLQWSHGVWTFFAKAADVQRLRDMSDKYYVAPAGHVAPAFARQHAANLTIKPCHKAHWAGVHGVFDAELCKHDGTRTKKLQLSVNYLRVYCSFAPVSAAVREYVADVERRHAAALSESVAWDASDEKRKSTYVRHIESLKGLPNGTTQTMVAKFHELLMSPVPFVESPPPVMATAVSDEVFS